MKKKNFVSLILGTAGGILFALGMCMCMIDEWNAFRQGIVSEAIGIVILLIMLIVRRKMEGKPAVRMNAKAVGTVLFGIVGLAGLSAAYPVYTHITRKRRAKLAPEILRLTDELTK